MKLNIDCVRDLLLIVESSDSNEPLWLTDICNNPQMIDYSKETVIYAIQKLSEDDYIDASILYGDDEVTDDTAVNSLTLKGHQFLENIRNVGIWEKIKAKISVTSNVSLHFLSELAVSYAKNQFGLS